MFIICMIFLYFEHITCIQTRKSVFVSVNSFNGMKTVRTIFMSPDLLKKIFACLFHEGQRSRLVAGSERDLIFLRGTSTGFLITTGSSITSSPTNSILIALIRIKMKILLHQIVFAQKHLF